jgi:hypothetical protein
MGVERNVKEVIYTVAPERRGLWKTLLFWKPLTFKVEDTIEIRGHPGDGVEVDDIILLSSSDDYSKSKPYRVIMKWDVL